MRLNTFLPFMLIIIVMVFAMIRIDRLQDRVLELERYQLEIVSMQSDMSGILVELTEVE